VEKGNQHLNRLYVALILFSSAIVLLKFLMLWIGELSWEFDGLLNNFEFGLLFCFIIYYTTEINRIYIVFFFECFIKIACSVNDWLEPDLDLYDYVFAAIHLSLIIFLITESIYFLTNEGDTNGRV